MGGMDRSWLAELDPDTVKPGLLGLVVVLALVVATVLLLRSFTHQLTKIDFDEGPEDDAEQDTSPDLPPGPPATGDDPTQRRG
jgi:hypothetical protein